MVALGRDEIIIKCKLEERGRERGREKKETKEGEEKTGLHSKRQKQRHR